MSHAVVRRTLLRGKCRDRCGHGCADRESPDCEAQRVIRFLYADEILGYLVEEASSRVELLSCTTIHVRILSADTTLAAWAIPLEHLRASSVQAGPDARGLFSVSKNEGAPCW